MLLRETGLADSAADLFQEVLITNILTTVTILERISLRMSDGLVGWATAPAISSGRFDRITNGVIGGTIALLSKGRTLFVHK
jgi:hypothetical protein